MSVSGVWCAVCVVYTVCDLSGKGAGMMCMVCGGDIYI